MTIVLGFDHSAGADRALTVALDLAAGLGEPLVLVYGAAPPGVRGEEFRAHEDAVVELGRQATAYAVERAREVGVDAEVEVVRERPAQALLDAAARHDARMVVVGSAGEGPIRGALLGSTAYRVLHQSQCPVLVVAARDEE